MKLLMCFSLLVAFCRCDDTNGSKVGEGGTIYDLFSNEETEFYSDHHSRLRDLIDLDGLEAERLWQKLEKKLDRELDKIRARGNEVPLSM
jgi:hypothetical protein